MILDELKNAGTYTSLGANFKLALEWLRKTDVLKMAPGRCEIDGDRVYALVQEVQTQPMEERRWEAHRNYADIQCVFAGDELMGYAPLPTMTESTLYDAEKDLVFYNGTGALLPVPAGSFAIFFPQDVHMPCVTPAGRAGKVKKVVVKVRMP